MKAKKTVKFFGLAILTLILLIVFYVLTAFVFSRIGIKAEQVKAEDVSVFILTNGVHTDIVVPIKNDQVDWGKEIKFGHTVGRDTAMDYVAFGWGDKGFYLETPTWADLKFMTAFKAAFGLSTSAIHTTFYKNIRENEACIKIKLSKGQYTRLAKYIENSFVKDANGHIINIATHANYGRNDAFYEAKGSYNLFQTCNTWTNDALKVCGQKACLWTPFDKGIFYQYKDE